MNEKNSNDTNTTDWSFVESRAKARGDRAPESEQVAYPAKRAELVPTETTPTSEITVPLPDTETSRGILMQWKKNQLDRKTALQALQTQYDAQLETLRYHLGKAVTVSNARADLVADKFLKKLDAEHMEILKDFGLRNAETRSDALIELRDMISRKLAEVQGKNWPPVLVERTIDDLFDLEKRVQAEMMKELGG